MRDIKVSIIVASYNYENFIKQTLDSILDQTYKNYEVIIVDDGSKDNSISVIEEYTKKYPNFYLYTHENNQNKGLSETIQLGLSKCTGDYVAFCESDDYWDKDYLQEKINLIKKHRNAVIISNDLYLVGNTVTKREYIKMCSDFMKINSGKNIFKELNNNYIPTFSCIMIKTKVLKNCNFNSPDKPWLDFWLWKQILLEHKVYYIDKKLTYWRIHGKSYNSNAQNEVLKRLDNFNKLAENHLKKSDPFAYFIQEFGLIPSVIKDKKHIKFSMFNISFKTKISDKSYSFADLDKVIAKNYKDTNAPKILLISHEFTLTGAPKVALIISKILKKIYGVSPIVFSFSDGPIKQEFIDSGIVVLKSESIFNKKYLEDIAGYFDLVLISSWCDRLFGAYSNKKLPPIIWYSHEPFTQKELYPLIKETINSMTQTWAGSPLTQEKMNLICPEKKTDLVLYGTEDLNICHNKKDDKITFLFPATVIHHKGQDVLVDAIKKLPDNVIDKAKFIIIGQVGNPEYYNYIKDSIKDIPAIELKDQVTFDKLMDYYSESDCIIVPSRHDPMPMVVTYGLMQKKLCIISDSIGTARLLENNKNALIFKNEDFEELANTLSDVIENFDDYKTIAENGRKVYEEYFSLECFENNIKKYVNDALQKNKVRKKLFVNILSIRNIGIYKIITICGIKLRFKSKKLLKQFGINKNSFFEDIFSIKTQKGKQRKIITILGIKIKLKRKPNLKDVISELGNIKSMQIECNNSYSNIKSMQIETNNSYSIIKNELDKFKTEISDVKTNSLEIINKNSNLGSEEFRYIIKNFYNDSIMEFLNEQIIKSNAIYNLHQKSFAKYKNINLGKTVVLVATGPSLENFIPIEDAIYLGVNKAFQYAKVHFDYLFLQDYSGITKTYIEDFCNYDSEKFIGILNEKLMPKSVIPDSYCLDKSIHRYYIEHPALYKNFTYDISSSMLGDAYSVVFPAMQFLLWTQPKKIYIVGCDSTLSGYYGSKESKNHLDINNVIDGWKRLKEFADMHYPNTKIISVNPIGLKGIFQDLYQKGEVCCSQENIKV